MSSAVEQPSSMRFSISLPVLGIAAITGTVVRRHGPFSSDVNPFALRAEGFGCVDL